MWPMCRPTEFAERQYRSHLLESNSPALQHAAIYSALIHRDYYILSSRGKDYPGRATLLQHKVSALNSLRVGLAKLKSKTVTDDLLTCILYMAVNDNPMSFIGRDKSPFSPPFPSLELLDFYGSCSFYKLHWD